MFQSPQSGIFFCNRMSRGCPCSGILAVSIPSIWDLLLQLSQQKFLVGGVLTFQSPQSGICFCNTTMIEAGAIVALACFNPPNLGSSFATRKRAFSISNLQRLFQSPQSGIFFCNPVDVRGLGSQHTNVSIPSIWDLLLQLLQSESTVCRRGKGFNPLNLESSFATSRGRIHSPRADGTVSIPSIWNLLLQRRPPTMHSSTRLCSFQSPQSGIFFCNRPLTPCLWSQS